jgi:hypothetical protein
VCAGSAADELEAAVDLAFLAEFGTDERAWGHNFVMTTAHAGASPDDVAHFFVMNTNFDDHDFRDFLVIHVGDSHLVKAVEAAVWRHAATTLPFRSLERGRER